MNFFESIFYYIRDTYTDRILYLPFNMQVSLLIVLFCFIALIELYIFIAFLRIRQNRRKKQLKYWREYIDDLLANLMMFDENEKIEDIVDYFYPKMLELPLKNHIVKKVLITQLLSYHKSFTGNIEEVITILYRKLGLEKEAKRKIRNRNWEVKIEGIREANEMRITEMAGEIIKYTDDENALLRMEAQASYIKLSAENPFHFLDRAHERILDWHQVVLFEIITKNKKIKIPSFSKWLRSPNDTVVMLCLKLTDHFMQFEAADEIRRLLKHHNPKIVKKTIEVIGKMELEDAERDMFEIYFDQTEDIKLEILNAIGKISSGNYSDFLASRIYSNVIRLKREALYAIKGDPENGEAKLKDLYTQTTIENQALIKHVLDNRIRQ